MIDQTGCSSMSHKNQQNECAKSEDSDQPGHLTSLIIVFPVRSISSFKDPGFLYVDSQHRFR